MLGLSLIRQAHCLLCSIVQPVSVPQLLKYLLCPLWSKYFISLLSVFLSLDPQDVGERLEENEDHVVALSGITEDLLKGGREGKTTGAEFYMTGFVLGVGT